MKSIFLNENEATVRRVYPPETIAALQTEAGLAPTVYSKEQLLADPSIGADADYIFTTWGMPTLTEDEIRQYLPNLKAVFYGAGSVQQFARPFLNCGVQVFSAWAANGVPVAEYTVAQIVLANTGFFQACAQCSTLEGRIAARSAQRANYDGNYDCAVGLIGAGMIGSMVAERLRDYHIRVMVFDPFLSDERAAQLGVEKTTLERIFTECQTISNHLANNPQTVGMLNYDRCFARMLPQATFINTGRGAQVVEPDLVRALTEVPTRTAVLDVTYPEPPVAESPFYTMPNVFLTPHIAGSKGKEVHRMSLYMLEEFRRLIAGEPTRWSVTPKMLETMA